MVFLKYKIIFKYNLLKFQYDFLTYYRLESFLTIFLQQKKVSISLKQSKILTSPQI